MGDADVFEHANGCVPLYLAEISGFARLRPLVIRVRLVQLWS
jgi:hypothetical protein